MRQLLPAALALLPLSALAAETPSPCARDGDPRERCVAYRPGQVIRVYAAPGATLTVELPATQQVFNVAVSDNAVISGGPGLVRTASGGGDATVDGNLMVMVPGGGENPQQFVTLKPLRHLEPQPLVILAWRQNPATGERALRRYTFELRTRPGELTEDVPDTFFSVRVSDPEAEREERAARWRQVQDEREARAAAARLRQTTQGGTLGLRRNLRYTGQGTAEDRAALAPVAGANPTDGAMWDDGMRTYLRYAGNRRPPMVYRVTPDGAEAVVGHHVEPDPTTNGALLVVHGVFSMLRLREGNRVLCLANGAYDATGQNPGTGTVDGGVVREAREPGRGLAR
jgi:type IV secretion system protein VirB9